MKPPSEFAQSVRVSLIAAREEATRVAKLHGTPLWFCDKDGRPVAVWPAACTTGQIFPGPYGTFCFVPASCLVDGAIDFSGYEQSGWVVRNVRLNAGAIGSMLVPERGSAPLEPESIPPIFIRRLAGEMP